MSEEMEIEGLQGREILDSRGNPTVEVEVRLAGGATGRAAVPSGASTGKFEAVELRDGGPRYHGLGVKKAVENVNTVLSEAVIFESALNQRHIDRLLREADGTENKENMGANAILGVSMAVARAAANALNMPLYRYLGGIGACQLPVPMMNILNGGKHADNTVDLQEFMIMPVGACCFSEGLRMCAEIYHTLKRLLKDNGYSTGVGDEGGFAPDFKDAAEVLSYMVKAVELAGFKPGDEVKIAIDAASSELYDEASGLYLFPGESQMAGHPVRRSSEELVDYYEDLVRRFPICSIEDGLQEEDWDGWQKLTKALGGKIQLVGGRSVRHQYQAAEKGHRDGGGKCHSGEGKSDRHLVRELRSHRDGQTRRIRDHYLPPVRRDGGFHHRGHRSGRQRRADQDRSSLPQRPGSQV